MSATATQTQRAAWPQRLAPLLVLIGAIALLQAHAIVFWMEHVGPTGWAWSILLEAVALWLWYQPALGKRLLGLVASVLVLLGPVHHVSEPLIEEVWLAPHRDASQAAQIEQLRQEQSRLEANLATFRANSEERTGWLPAIQQTEQRLGEVNTSLVDLLAEPPAGGLAWRQQAVILMQATALVLFQVTAILAITTLSRQADGAARRPARTVAVEAHAEPSQDGAAPEPGENTMAVSEPPSQGLEPETDDPYRKGAFSGEAIRALCEALDRHLADEGISQAEFARRHRVAPRDLSFLRNHENRARQGKRTVSTEALHRLRDILPDPRHPA